MRGPEGRVADERPVGCQKTGDGVDPGHFQRLGGAERGQKPGQPPREHRLAGPGRPGQQEVVTPGGCELERTTGALLPPHVGKVGIDGRRRLAVLARLVRLRLDLSSQVRGRLGEMADGHRLDPGQGCLGCGLGGAEQAVEPRPPGSLGGGDCAADRSHAPVQGQLAEGGVSCEAIGRHLVGGAEHGERDRKVEARALLPQSGRGEVHRDAAGGPEELCGGDPAANPMLRLLARAVGQTDDGEAGLAELDMRLDLDPTRVQTDKGVGEHPCEHDSMEAE